MVHYQAKYEAKPKKGKKGRSLPILLGIALFLAAAGWFLVPPITEKLMLEPYSEVTVEAGTSLPPAEAFLPEDAGLKIAYASDVASIKTNIPGDYSVILTLWKGNYTATVHVVDTTPPAGEIQNLTAHQDSMPSAEDFLLSTQDVTEVSARFASEPSSDQGGEQTVTILLTDTSGNETRLEALLTVILDEEAPIIEGVQDITLYQGGTVAYRSGIIVTDNRDPNPQLTIDSSSVDLSTPGTYTVTYTAEDAAGNICQVTAAITVLLKKDSYVEFEVIYAKVDEILSTIVNDEMTDREKVTAIYKWIRSHCVYSNASDKDDWMQAAYTMMKNRSGDCFNYFALCKLMLERLGIPNIDVEKVPNYAGDSHHYWSLVSVDGGETYYHLDLTPRVGDFVQFLLVTDEFMDSYSAQHKNCFNRDKSLYPATPEE